MSSLVAPTPDAPPLARVGLPELVKATSPAAGANFTATARAGYMERIIAVSFRLTPDANAANRTAYVESRDETGVRTMMAGANVTVAASTTTDFFFSWALGQPDWLIASTVVAPLTPLLLLPEHDWRIVIDSIQAGDTITRIRYWREVFDPVTF